MARLSIEGGGFSPDLLKVCTSLIASHLGKVPGRTLVIADEIGAMLSLEVKSIEQELILFSDCSRLAGFGEPVPLSLSLVFESSPKLWRPSAFISWNTSRCTTTQVQVPAVLVSWSQ